MHRASAFQFLPHNSAASQSMVVVSMQMDAYLKKEQIGTLFVWVGPQKRGFRGWGGGRGVQPKIWTSTSWTPTSFFLRLLLRACISIEEGFLGQVASRLGFGPNCRNVGVYAT